MCISSGGRGRWVVSPVALAMVPVGIGPVGNLATGTVEVQVWWWAPATWVLTGVLVVVAVAAQVVRSRAVPPSREAAMRGAVAELRRRVREQWEHEAVLRGVRQPVPLRVRWSSTGRPVAEARPVVLDEPQSTWQDLPLEGDVTQIVEKFRGLPHRQLVVLGEAGAGKSVLAMLLTLGLIEQSAADDPVPVLLPATSWDPREESVREFQRAVDAGRRVVSRAAVVEIMLVDVEQVIAFLSHPEPFRHRWEPVFTHLRDAPDGPLARVLSTALTVSLARTAYTSAETDPTALTRLGGRDAVTAALMDTFVTSVHDPDRPVGIMTGEPEAGAAGALVVGLLTLVVPFLPSRTGPRSTTPRATLNANHRATAVAAAQHGGTAALVFAASAAALAPAAIPWTAVTAAAVYGWFAACGAGLSTWIDYKITHVRLAAKGRLPWRLWAFLEDQHQRQTLRQSGTAWQFRHALPHAVPAERSVETHAVLPLLSRLLTMAGREEEALTMLVAHAHLGDPVAVRLLAERAEA